MVRTVLKYVAIAMVALLIILWFWLGGFSQIVRFVKSIPNPIDIIWGTSTSTYSVVLPWQIPVPQGPDIEGLANEGAALENASTQERLEELQRQYDSIQNNGSENALPPGAQSPYFGRVTLSRASATESNPANEYVVLDAHSNIGGVAISGWSLQSSLTGRRVVLSLAAPQFEMGIINSVRSIYLESGQHVIVTTGLSPVGVSFRENRCTGYLAQALTFEPSLSSSCPSPADSMPLTERNLQQYGGDCIDFVRSLPQCTFPTSLPAALSTACRSHVVNTFSYNGCAQTYRNQPSFTLDTWRVYLAYPTELWGNTHDVIRLLDEYGRVIDSVTY